MKKIMLVDDIKISNFIVRKMIEKCSFDFKIHDYTLPAKALDELAQVKPDLIFLDLNMPIIDGWEFLDKMKENNLMFPVYVLTSSTTELDSRKYQHYENVIGFLIKPLNVGTLAGILDECASLII